MLEFLTQKKGTVNMITLANVEGKQNQLTHRCGHWLECEHDGEMCDEGAGAIVKSKQKMYWGHKARIVGYPRQGVPLDAVAVSDASVHDSRTVLPHVKRLFENMPEIEDKVNRILYDIFLLSLNSDGILGEIFGGDLHMKQKKTTSPYIVVRQSRIHSRGVFAKKDIPEGTRIIEYVGEKVTKAESNRRADIPLNRHKEDKSNGAVYIFELNKRFDIDGDVPYNTAKYINHSCGPNCEVEIIRGHIWIISTRDISQGEEITYNYGYEYEDYEEHPCCCGTNRCAGYIMSDDHWPKLRKSLARKRKKQEQFN